MVTVKNPQKQYRINTVIFNAFLRYKAHYHGTNFTTSNQIYYVSIN